MAGMRSARQRRTQVLLHHPADTSRMTLVRAIKARWACEQAYQQLKDELGLDHYEGRSWLGLHHHALLSMIAFSYLQHRRLQSVPRAGKNRTPHAPGPTPQPSLPAVRRANIAMLHPQVRIRCSHCGTTLCSRHGD